MTAIGLAGSSASGRGRRGRRGARLTAPAAAARPPDQPLPLPSRSPPGRRPVPRPGAAAPAIAGRDLAGERLGPAGDRAVPVDRQVRQERDLLAAMVDPAGHEEDRALGPGRGGLSYIFGNTTTSIVPWRSSSVATPIVAFAFVITRRNPVTIPPMTTRWPSSDSSLRSLLNAVTYWPTCSATSPIGCSERYSPRSSFSQRRRSRTGTSVA